MVSVIEKGSRGRKDMENPVQLYSTRGCSSRSVTLAAAINDTSFINLAKKNHSVLFFCSGSQQPGFGAGEAGEE